MDILVPKNEKVVPTIVVLTFMKTIHNKMMNTTSSSKYYGYYAKGASYW